MLSRSQICILAVQFVVFERYIDVLIPLGVPPSGSLVDQLVFRIRGCRWTKDSLNLVLRHFLVDLVIVRPIQLRYWVCSVVATRQRNCDYRESGEKVKESTIHEWRKT
jgi:hypothetical protein